MLPCFHPPLLLAVEAEEKARQDEKQRAIDAREAQADAEQAKRLEERGFVVAKQASSVSTGIVSYRIVSYRIVSYRIVSYRIVSYRIVSQQTPMLQIQPRMKRRRREAPKKVEGDPKARLARVASASEP